MLRSITGIVFISLFIGMLTGCQSKNAKNDQSVSPGLVTNPISASGNKQNGNLPVMTFEKTKHDFDLMVQGEKLSYTFKFTNTGGSDLIISNASATCGCTVPNYSKAPVKPGAQGNVEVIFNSSGKTGTVRQTVKLLTNCQPNSTELEITAEVYVPNSKK